MIVEPERYLAAFAEAGADHLLVQAEPGSTIHLHRVLTQIHALGKKAGVALDPATPAGACRICPASLRHHPGDDSRSRIRRAGLLARDAAQDPTHPRDVRGAGPRSSDRGRWRREQDDGGTSGSGRRQRDRGRFGDLRGQGLQGGHCGDPRQRRRGAASHERGRILSRCRPERLKRAAAEAAVELVQDGMVVGLGTGSTAAFAVDALARRHRQGLRFLGIPTSERTAEQAKAAGIPLTSFAEHRRIDLTIDGADEVERGTLNLIKGLGGALLREKIVAAASRRLAIIVDGAKLVDRLGVGAPVPVEVVAFGLKATWAALEGLGASIRLRLSPAGDPFVTDGGNRILDCSFGPIADPARLEKRIGRVVGVVESGLFISRADLVFVADTAGVHRLESPRAHRGQSADPCAHGRVGRRQVNGRAKNWLHASAGRSRRAMRFILRRTSPRCMPEFR